MDKYVNILEKHKIVSSDFPWVTRPIVFTKAYKQRKPLPNPDQLKLIVYHNNELNEILSNVSTEGGCSNSNSYADLLWKTVEEIGYSYDLAIIRWLSLFLVKILKKSLNGIYINEERLMKIKNEIGTNPVIFVPTHRSYADFILMAFVTFDYDIHIPCVAAALDFLSMKIMNKFLRKSKAFFIRRKFANDLFYKTVFQEYIKTLVTLEESPIEFYIEGTRSRTGKTLTPKLGLLSILVDAYISGEIPDITFVPVTINYDKILEDGLFAYELLGVPKPKESTRGFLKALKFLNQSYGNVYMTFSEPFSVRKYLDNNINFFNRCSQNENIQIKKIAYNIIEEQQKQQIFNCFNLLALVLNNNLIQFGEYKINLSEAIKKIKWLISISDLLGIRVSLVEPVENTLLDYIKLHNSIVELSKTNEICIKQVDTSQITNDVSLNYGAVPAILLQIYVNPMLFFFIKLSIIILIASENLLGLKKEVFLNTYNLFCNLFKNEFAFNLEKGYDDFSKSLSILNNFHIINLRDDSVEIKNDNNDLIKFLSLLIEPFISTYYCICLLLNNNSTFHNKKLNDIIKIMQISIENKLLNKELVHPYCLSKDLISNALCSLTEMNILIRHKVLNDYLYEVNKSNLLTLMDSIYPYVDKKNTSNFSLKKMKIINERAKL